MNHPAVDSSQEGAFWLNVQIYAPSLVAAIGLLGSSPDRAWEFSHVHRHLRCQDAWIRSLRSRQRSRHVDEHADDWFLPFTPEQAVEARAWITRSTRLAEFADDPVLRQVAAANYALHGGGELVVEHFLRDGLGLFPGLRTREGRWVNLRLFQHEALARELPRVRALLRRTSPEGVRQYLQYAVWHEAKHAWSKEEEKERLRGAREAAAAIELTERAVRKSTDPLKRIIAKESRAEAEELRARQRGVIAKVLMRSSTKEQAMYGMVVEEGITRSEAARRVGVKPQRFQNLQRKIALAWKREAENLATGS